MKRIVGLGLLAVLTLLLAACPFGVEIGIEPVYVSDPVVHDSDDPAVWIDSSTPANSLILGTDKSSDGALFVYDVQGNELPASTVTGLDTPNNVDVEYGLAVSGAPTDIAVVTERDQSRLRIYSLPTMTPVDGGGVPVFVGASNREPMGIGLYKRPSDGEIFAVVSRSGGPSGSYLWQYRLHDDNSDGVVTADHVRSFGYFSGRAQVESVAVDDELEFIYYSDELAGVRKYHADPDHPDAAEELALIGSDDLSRESEGVSIYDLGDGTGYLIISDQKANRFNIYPREGSGGDPHDHPLIKRVYTTARDSDGNETASTVLLSDFPGGLFVAMSTDRTFHYYAWNQLSQAPGAELRSLTD